MSLHSTQKIPVVVNILHPFGTYSTPKTCVFYTEKRGHIVAFIVDMKWKFAEIEKVEFKDRLTEALTNAGVRLSPTIVAREYNLRAGGPAISIHAVRKWLVGDSYPTQPRINVLARWLAVSPQWLRFGDSVSNARFASNSAASIPHREVLMLTDFRRLDERSQAVVSELIASLLKHHSLRK